MYQSKFSLADLLCILSSLVFGFFCFLSLNFLSLGETLPSIIYAAVIALILGGLSLGAKLLKRTRHNFKACIVTEWVFLGFFAVAAVAAFFPFSHFFAISQQKEEIQNTVIHNIGQAENIFADYESYADNRLNIYENKLKSVVRGKRVNPREYSDFGFVPSTANNVQIENKMFTLKAHLYPANYQEMKTNDSIWLSDAKTTLSSWRPIGIVTVTTTLDPTLISLKTQLTDFSKFRAQGEVAKDFDYNLSFGKVKDTFTEFGKPTLLSVLCSLVLYTLMLLSYFITERDSKFPGFKLIFGTDKIKDNEL